MLIHINYPAYPTGVARFTNGYNVLCLPNLCMDKMIVTWSRLEDFWVNYTSSFLAGGFMWAFSIAVRRTDHGRLILIGSMPRWDWLVDLIVSGKEAYIQYAKSAPFSSGNCISLLLLRRILHHQYLFIYSISGDCRMNYRFIVTLSPLKSEVDGCCIDSGAVRHRLSPPVKTGYAHHSCLPAFGRQMLELEADRMQEPL